MGVTASTPTPSSLSIAAAKVELLHARAAAVKRRAETEARRAEAVAEAARAHSAVEARRAEAEAEAARAHSAVEARRAEAEAEAARAHPAVEARFGLMSAGMVMAALLAVDFYVHESPSHIRRRMLGVLRQCRLPPSVARRAPEQLPLPQRAPVLRGLPLMVLGPTGCGKSTLLASLAREAVAGPHPVPTILVRLRLPSQVKNSSPRPAGLENGKTLMDAAAMQIYEQIGYPVRRSLLGSLLFTGFTYKGALNKAELGALSPSGVRLVGALSMLFSVCKQLSFERQAQGVPAQFAAPVLIFDELQDLIKDSRLKAAGGELVFEMIATQIVAYGVDYQVPAVRVAVAGSSAELWFAFSETVAKGNRWYVFTLSDPSPATVLDALEKRGYSSQEAQEMVAMCGTRLRLLSAPLDRCPLTLSSADFLAKCREDGESSLLQAFEALDGASTLRLAAVLEALAAADAADAAGETARRPTPKDLPPSMQGQLDSSIFYVKRSKELFFQSQLQACAWKKLRARYVTSVTTARLQ